MRTVLAFLAGGVTASLILAFLMAVREDEDE